LFSAAELSVKAWLWTGPLGFELSERMRHGEIGNAFSKYVQWGNADPGMLKTFQALIERRALFKYGRDDVDVHIGQARRWLENVQAMLAGAELAVKSVMESTDTFSAAFRAPVTSDQK
jgi:hypothetical protein